MTRAPDPAHTRACLEERLDAGEKGAIRRRVGDPAARHEDLLAVIGLEYEPQVEDAQAVLADRDQVSD